MWTLNVVFGTVGVLAVFKSHNDPISGYIANMYSLHSWAGMTVLSLYAIQYLVGMLAFSGLSGRRRISNPILMEIHKFAGSYIHILATTTILLGIQEKEGFVSCAYTVESPDVPPEFNVGKIPYPCKISHGLGVVILLMGLCTNFGLAKL
jgi:cytochrome b561